MTSATIPPIPVQPNGMRPSLAAAGGRLLRLLTRAPSAPLRQLSVYYLGLGALGLALGAAIPFVGSAIGGMPLVDGSDAGALRDLLQPPSNGIADTLAFDARMVIVMVGTLLITIPFSWGYMSIRARAGFEQSVVQTLVILPIVVAAIMMVVQFSLALAFALGGVAAAVRFRNTLKDVADATYVFLAIGIGISAGTGALSAALVMSAVFTFSSVLLWRCNFGECEASTGPAPKPVRGRSAPTSTRDALMIEIPEPAQQAQVEALLGLHTKGWKLRRADTTEVGRIRLLFAVRRKRSMSSEALIGTLQGQVPAGARVLPGPRDRLTGRP